jgi:hypothetical protein
MVFNLYIHISKDFIQMASTRNKNTPSDYCLQQRSYANALTHNTYEYSYAGRAFNPAMPEIGITPSHMSRDTLSNNAVDIESSLRGINSVNLVIPHEPVKPQLKHVQSVSFFERTPVIMPEEFSLLRDQRPFPIPN